MRAVLALAALLTGGALALLWAAGGDASMPWRAAERHVFEPSELMAMGARRVDGIDAEAVFEGADGLGRSLLMARNLTLDAAHWSRLSYRFDAFPATLKLVLVWRVEDSPERLRSLPLPRPGSRGATVLLDGVEDWEGRISELGVLVLPADLLPAEATLERRIVLRELSLESRSQSGALAALLTEWSAYRPWVGRSINTAGFELASPQRHSLLGFVLALALLLGLAAWLLFRPRLSPALAVGVALVGAWVALDLVQLAQLHWRGDFTRQAHRQGEEIQVDPRLSAILAELQPTLHALDPRLVLVSGDSPFHRTYGAFRLLPLPVAVVESPPALPEGEQRLALVLIGADAAGFDAATGTLRWGARSYVAEAVFDAPPVRAFRLLAGAEAGVRP